MARTMTTVINDSIREIGTPGSIEANWNIPVERPGWDCAITIGIRFLAKSKMRGGPVGVSVIAHGHLAGDDAPRGRVTYVALLGHATIRRFTRKWIESVLRAEIEIARAAALGFTEDDLTEELQYPSEEVYREMDERFENSLKVTA